MADGTIREFLADRDCMLIVAVEDGVVLGAMDGFALRQPHVRRPQFLLYEIDVTEQYRRRAAPCRTFWLRRRLFR